MPGSFRRAGWREAFRPAEAPTLEGWQVLGPEGVVVERLEGCLTPLRRMRGLLGRKTFEPGQGLLIQPCHQVHTFGMEFGIDAVFCSRDGKVIAVESLPPGRISRPHPTAKFCVELPLGAAADRGVASGVLLRLVPASPAALSDAD